MHLSTCFENRTHADNDQPEKKLKPGGGCWVHDSCQVLLNSIQQLQRRSRKCLSQSETGETILLFPSSKPPPKFVRERWDLASYQVSLNSVQLLQRRSWKCLSQSEARAAILIFWSARKTENGKGPWDFAPCQVSINSVQQLQKSKMWNVNNDGQLDEQNMITIVHLLRCTKNY